MSLFFKTFVVDQLVVTLRKHAHAEIKVVKNENFQWKFFDIFIICAQNIDCGYTIYVLELNKKK